MCFHARPKLPLSFFSQTANLPLSSSSWYHLTSVVHSFIELSLSTALQQLTQETLPFFTPPPKTKPISRCVSPLSPLPSWPPLSLLSPPSTPPRRSPSLLALPPLPTAQPSPQLFPPPATQSSLLPPHRSQSMPTPPALLSTRPTLHQPHPLPPATQLLPPALLKVSQAALLPSPPWPSPPGT